MSPLRIVFLVVLVDLLGFAIVMPLLPRYAAQLGHADWQIGLLLAAYPLGQLVAGPILGRLSDRFGRRPVLVLSQAGTALSFVVLALATDYPTMLLARLLDGLSGGNVLVAQAYVADVTKPEERARGLGLIGAAFGLGFVLGPLLGAGLVRLPVDPSWQLRLPFLVAAVFSTVAWLLVLTRLPESLPRDGSARPPARVLSWSGLVTTLRDRPAARIILVSALVTTAFAALEGTYSRYLDERFGWDAAGAALGFALLGLASAVVQGGAIRPLVRRFGERRLIVAGAAMLAAGLAGLAAVGPGALVGLSLAAALVAAGAGLASPSAQGLLSRVAPEAEQGAVFGTLSSAQTFARLINYLAANALLGKAGPAAPYWEGAALALVAAALALGLARGATAAREEVVL